MKFVYTIKIVILCLQECNNFELKVGNKLCNFVAFYKSPSQTQDEFEKFSDNLELNLGTCSPKKAFLVIVISASHPDP